MKSELIERLRDCKENSPDYLSPKFDELINNIDKVLGLARLVNNVSGAESSSIIMSIDNIGVHFKVPDNCILTLTFAEGIWSASVMIGEDTENYPLAVFKQFSYAYDWVVLLVNAKYAKKEESEDDEPVQWRDQTTVDSIIKAFPEAPTADDILDLYDKNKKLKDKRISALLVASSSKVRPTYSYRS